MNIKAAIFDLDGTLADTIPVTIKAIKETVRELKGEELTDEEILKEFGPVDTEIVKKLVDGVRKELVEERYIKIFSESFDKCVRPIEGIIELLDFIKSKGIRLGLFTGRGIRATEIIIEKLRLKEYFDIVIAGEHTRKPKPDPEGIMLALEKLGIRADESVYTGDFDVDIKASRAAGTKSVLALWSSTGSEDLIGLKPDKYFRKPDEFIKWLGNTTD
ncbi:MAG: HAD-IA family hydrolase [Clostridia bacterium]|nr:HAD-IA family hydrolase [Clostridia bacterium]